MENCKQLKAYRLVYRKDGCKFCTRDILAHSFLDATKTADKIGKMFLRNMTFDQLTWETTRL